MSYTIDRDKLNEGDVCAQCHKDLRTVKEIHVVEGMHFCCEKCAIDYETNVIIASAKETAKSWYRDCSEIVTPTDIGLIRENIWTLHDNDITVIFKSTYIDNTDDSLVSTEVIGFYFGEPDDDATREFSGKLKAEY